MTKYTSVEAEQLLDSVDTGLEHGRLDAAGANRMQDLAGIVALVAVAKALEQINGQLSGINEQLRSIDQNSIVTEGRS